MRLNVITIHGAELHDVDMKRKAETVLAAENTHTLLYIYVVTSLHPTVALSIHH